jgi:osmoprotectant transport system ATP-binding protein
LRTSLLRIRREIGLTAIFVTHDMTEALLLGDRIAVLHHGELVQVGAPSELVRSPADEYVARLMSAPRRNAAAVDALITESKAS